MRREEPPAEDTLPLGPPVRKQAVPPPNQARNWNASGTIKIDSKGRLSTNIPPPAPPTQPVWPFPVPFTGHHLADR